MLVLEDSDMIQLNNAAQYKAWKGHLYIHEQLVCDISLQTPSTCSIPAQLPEKLDLREVIQLSELRKKLPEDIFQKTDFTGQEVFCENIYYSLYPVITTNTVGSELDNLLKCLKDQDLALIKVLNDQGFLILVNSAVLPNGTGIFDGNSVQLNALFLFPHQKFLDIRDREEWEGKFIRKELPLTVSNLLPGLHYAIIESSKLQKDKALYPGPLVEQYFKKYAVLQSKKDSSSEGKPEQSGTLSAFYSPGDDPPKKCSPLAFSCLQLYISSPINFSVPVIKMNNILAENAFISSNTDQFAKTAGSLIKQDNLSSPSKRSKAAESKAGSGRRKGKHGVHEDKEQHSKKATRRRNVKRREKKSKKKPVQRSALTTAETGENQASIKRRRLLSEDKKQSGSSSETTATVKLANVPFSQRRKRGAEVLSAAFIQDEKIETTEKITSSKTNEENTQLTPKTRAIKRKTPKAFSTEEQLVVPDRRSKRKMSDPGNKTMTVEVINKSESMKRTSERNHGKTGRTNKRSQDKMKSITVEQINPSEKSSESLKDAQTWPPPAQFSEDNIIEKRISMYESHALNLLADLALNSFGSSSIPYLPSVNVALTPEVLVEETARRADHVSTVESPAKDCSPPARSTTACSEPEHILASESDKPKNSFSSTPRNTASHKRIETGEKQISQKAHFAAAKAKARYNATSKISLEHSYSQLPMENVPGKSAKEATEQPVQGVPDSTTSAHVVPESSANGLPGEVLLAGGDVSPVTGNKQRGVSKFQDNVVITVHWEPNYDFDLDSKFTSDPLEKTINRALHGPWNTHLKEKVEDVKIILHMWIALFYSKSSKQIRCNSRKVVEHSNPAKYVSINTVLDPFEFYEIMETDNSSPAINTNILLPVAKKAEALHSEDPIKSGKSESVSLQDLILPSIPTKDYNIKLASEIFQMCKDSESAFYSDSLQTSMTCQMAPTSKSAQISGYIVPTVCYIGDTNLFNTELTDKSKNYLDIGGFSSEKAKSKETEHKYFRDFFATNKAEKSTGSRTNFSKIISSNDKEGNVKACETVSAVEHTSHTPSDLFSILDLTMAPTSRDSHETTSKLRFADKNKEYSGIISKTIHRPEIPTKDDLNKDITNKNPDSVDPSSETVQDSNNFLKALELTKYIAKSPSDRNDANTEFCMDKTSNIGDSLKAEALKFDKRASEIIGAKNISTSESVDETAISKLVQREEDSRQVGDRTENIATHPRPQIENSSPSISPDLSKPVDYEGDCTGGRKTRSALDGVGFEGAQKQAMADIPVQSENLGEHNTHKLDENDLSEVEKTENAVTEEPFLPLNIAQSRLRDDVAEESLSEASTKDDSFTHETAEEPHDGACFVNELSPATANSFELDANEVIFTLGKLDIKDNEHSSMESEEHVHKDVLAESQNRLLISQTQFDVEKLQNSSCSVQTVNKKVDLPGSPVKEMQNYALSTKTEPSTCQNVVKECVRLGTSMDMLEGGSNVNASSETALHLNITSCFSDQLMRRYSEMDSVQPSVGTQQLQPTGDASPTVKPIRSGKDSTQSSRSSSSNKKEILSKLKRICLGSIAGNQASSNFENVISGDENINGFTNEKNKVVDEAKSIHLLEDEDKSSLKNLDVVVEEPAMEDYSVEPKELAVETCIVEAEEPAMENCNVEADEPAIDSSSVETEEPAAENCNVEAEQPAMKNCNVESEETAVENCDVDAEEPAMENFNVEAEEPAAENCNIEAEQPAKENCNIDETEEPAKENCNIVTKEPAMENCNIEAEEPAMENCNIEAEESAMENCNIEAEEPAMENCNIEAGEPAMENFNVEAEEPEMESCNIEAEELSVENRNVEAGAPAVEKCNVVEAEESAVEKCNVEADESAVEKCNVVEAEESAVEKCNVVEAEEFTMENCNVVESEEFTMENCDVVAEEPIIDSSSPEELVIINVNSVEPEIIEEVMPPQDNCLISSSFEDVSDSIEQDPSPKLPDICFIVNTGSISKEQYDRWSETSDDDIEYIRSYTEPLSHKDFQEDIPEPPSLPEEVKRLQKQTPTIRTTESFRKQTDSNSGLFEADENRLQHLKDREYNSKTNHGNVTVTRNFNDRGCATRTIRKEISRSDLDHVFADNRTVSDNLTQNTLDMENLRFTCKVKEILRKSSTDNYIYGPNFQTMFDSRRIPSSSHSTMKCSNPPLLITVRCPYRRADFRRPDGRHPSNYNSSSYYEDELWDEPVTYSRTIRKVRTQRYSPFHFSRLRYETTLDKSNSDISVILNECVQSNHLKLSSVGLGTAAGDRTSASEPAEEGGQQPRTSVPVSSKSKSVKNIISDLRTSLHSRLQNVARETEQKMAFYIYETDDADFISSAKSLLEKDGHIPMDPWDFLNNEQCESHQLLVVIKNEDVVSSINKIPYLMQLKLLHNVTFAGVDTPEDMTESTYEELFQAGGFVVSDKNVLENITLGKLKEVLAVLEKMSRTSPWKWLIHYRENRKLKEDKRTEVLSRAKMTLLKSYQQSNVIEILPYHQCDSRSKEPSDDLACLLSLQHQHIHSRLSVYLTGTTSTLTDVYERNGILVFDVDTFLRKIQKVDSQLQSS